MSRKYDDFRNQYKFVEVVSNEVVQSGIQPCDCCKGIKNDLFASKFIVSQTNFNHPTEQLNQEIVKNVCTKCLHYVYKLDCSVYKTGKRQQRFKLIFKDLHNWCITHQTASKILPTLSRFCQLCEDGGDIKPKLTEHVLKLIHSLTTIPLYMEYIMIYATHPMPNAQMKDLMFKIDACEAPSCETINVYVQHYQQQHPA